MRQAWSRRKVLTAAGIGAVGLTVPRFACAQDVPSIAYESVPDLLRLPPDLYLGEVSGVALNSVGHIFVLHRGNSTGPAYGAAAAQLLEFDGNGDYLREIGHNLYAWSFAHTVKVDREDNVWVTDKGSDMVIKFTPEGRVDMVFGRKQEASDEDTAPLKHPNPPLPARDGYFRQVTDVAWDGAGDAYISDGYINSRVAKVSKDGDWLKSWGERGTGPGQFHTPHSIAVDASGLVYVADRSNRRIQVFDGEGAFQRQFTIDAPVPPDAKPAIGNMPGEAEIAAAPLLPARRGRSAYRRRRTRFFTPRVPDQRYIIEGLERFRSTFRSQRQFTKAFPDDDVVVETDRMDAWISGQRGDRKSIKMWKKESWGDQEREGPRILAFLKAAQDIQLSLGQIAPWSWTCAGSKMPSGWSRNTSKAPP